MKTLFEFLDYSPASGVFTWKKSPSSRAKVGAQAGVLQSLGYRQIKLKGVRVYAHRLAWFFVTGSEPKFEIDHVNGDRDDNRFSNLRDLPRRLNVQNQRRTRKAAGLLGTTQNIRSGKWRASVTTDGVVTNLGPFATEIEAHAAYVREKLIQHEGYRS